MLTAQMFGLFLLSYSQCAFLTGDQLRHSEWRQSAARGKYTPLPFSPAVHSLHRMTVNLDLNLFWGAVARYAVFTFTSQSCVPRCRFPPLEPVSSASI